MRRVGPADLLVLLGFVALLLDSRRFLSLARWRGGGRRRPGDGGGMPAGARPDQIGLPLGQIQMRHHVDWQDGGIGWDGPEILPGDDEADAFPVTVAEPEPMSFLPVLWKPFPALPPAGGSSAPGPLVDAARN
jgi:hypothetical protein